MEKKLYLLVISLPMLYHQVLAYKANFCNITESYFVEVTKTETVLEFKKPTGFHLLGMFSSSNKYENITKLVPGVEKRERIVEECCKGFKRKGDECVPINNDKPAIKSSTTGTSTTTTATTPTAAATEPSVKPTEPSSSTPTTHSLIAESKTVAPIEPSSTQSFSTEPPPSPTVTELKVAEQVSTEISSPEPSSPELSTESKPVLVSTEIPAPEPSSPEPSVESKPIHVTTEMPAPEPSSPEPPTESKPIHVTTEMLAPEPSSPEPSTESKPIHVTTEMPAPEPSSPEPSTESKPVLVSTEIPAPKPSSPEPAKLITEQSSSSTESKLPEPIISETTPLAPPTDAKTLEPTSTAIPSTESQPSESVSPEPNSSESKAEPIIAKTTPLTSDQSTTTEPSLPPEHPTNPVLVNELITDPSAVDTDQTTIVNGRKKRNIDIPFDSFDHDTTEQDLQLSVNDRPYPRNEYHEIVVNNIEDENDNTTWIEVLELFSFGAVVFLLVITVQASYDGQGIPSLWTSENKNQSIDSYGEYWIYDSQVSLEEV